MRIGARTIKTGLAITLTLLLCKALQIQPAVFAAITSLVNMQPSVRKALRNAWEQISVHLLGVAVAILFGWLFGNSPFIIGIAVIVMIVICNRLGWSGGITLGVVSIIFVLDAPQAEFLKHASIRSLGIFLGLGVALIVNRFLAPPEYKNIMLEKLEHTFQESSAYFLESILNYINSATLTSYKPENPLELQQKLDEVNSLYENAREELTAKDNLTLIERFLEICRGFIERGQIIDEMTANRVQRRQSPDSPLPNEIISSEFQSILDILRTGETKLKNLVEKVMVGFKAEHVSEKIEEDMEYWGNFDQAIDNWQRKVSGVFYLRAMMEVAVVATEMRWAARRLKKIYNLSAKAETRKARGT